jgi:hypothetical protein
VHRFPAPPPPSSFEDSVKPFRAAVRKSVQRKRAPTFRPKWADFKAEFSRAQFRKRGFCEMPTVGVYYGDVEHYRPKSELQELDSDPETHGVERENLATVVGRRPKLLSPTGYWWEAYSWDNYLLACIICNSQWKRTIFPVQNVPRRVPPSPRNSGTEVALLLNPFYGPNPKDHLEFDSMGVAKPRNGSLWGAETIKTCGLNRPSLLENRRDVAARTHRRIDDLPQLLVESELRRVLRDIHDDGIPRAPNCGMVRAIYEQRTNMSWDQLNALVGQAGT